MRNLSELSVPAITYTDVVPPPPNPLSNDTTKRLQAMLGYGIRCHDPHKASSNGRESDGNIRWQSPK